MSKSKGEHETGKLNNSISSIASSYKERSKTAHLIVSDREKNGNFLSLEDFINRIPIGIENMKILIFIDAFRFTGKTKNQLLVVASLLLNNFKPENRSLMLMQEPVKEYKLPTLERSLYEDAFDEIELLNKPAFELVFYDESLNLWP